MKIDLHIKRLENDLSRIITKKKKKKKKKKMLNK